VAQGLLTAVHVLLSLTLLKVVPGTHASHMRSAVAEPAVFWPWPAGHVAQAEHAPLPATSLKWPAAHAAQSRSDVVVGAALRYSPAAHSALTAVHALPLSVLLKVATPSHASHTRSAVAEPAVFWPWAAGHVAQAAHASLPAVVLNICSGHSEHTRSDVVVGSAVEYSPAEQVFTVWHTRSDVVVGAVNVN
jgi:hypothetical protein